MASNLNQLHRSEGIGAAPTGSRRLFCGQFTLSIASHASIEGRCKYGVSVVAHLWQLPCDTSRDAAAICRIGDGQGPFSISVAVNSWTQFPRDDGNSSAECSRSEERRVGKECRSR